MSWGRESQPVRPRHDLLARPTDDMMRGAVEQYLYLAAQSTIDLANAFIAFRGFRKPSSMGESFTILREAGVLPSPQAEELVRMTGFRNALAYNYEGLDYEIVHSVLRERLEDFEDFAALISKLVQRVRRANLPPARRTPVSSCPR